MRPWVSLQNPLTFCKSKNMRKRESYPRGMLEAKAMKR